MNKESPFSQKIWKILEKKIIEIFTFGFRIDISVMPLKK
jgi:hypothetical protein